MIDLIGTGQLDGYPIKPMCSVLVNEWAFYGPYTTLPFVWGTEHSNYCSLKLFLALALLLQSLGNLQR